MTWATLTPDGRVMALYQRMDSAALNGGGRPVVPAPADSNPMRDWRFELWAGWVLDPVPDPNAVRLEAMGRDERRRQAYSREDRDGMLEFVLEVALALAVDPAVAARLRPSTLAKAETLNARIAAVKAANP
jgi:hypothetical protein